MRLEPLPIFLAHAVELNRALAPEGRHDAIASGEPDGAHARGALALIHRDFPGGPLHEQAAYLIRAFAGLQPFDEANHRTAWGVVANHLEHHGHSLLVGDEDGRALGNEVWDRMLEAWPDGMPREAVTSRDAVFGYLSHWFLHRVA